MTVPRLLCACLVLLAASCTPRPPADPPDAPPGPSTMVDTDGYSGATPKVFQDTSEGAGAPDPPAHALLYGTGLMGMFVCGAAFMYNMRKLRYQLRQRAQA